MLQAGEAVSAVADMLSDGRIDSSDRPKLRGALRQLDEVIAAALAMEATLERATQPPGAGVSSLRRAS